MHSIVLPTPQETAAYAQVTIGEQAVCSGCVARRLDDVAQALFRDLASMSLPPRLRHVLTVARARIWTDSVVMAELEYARARSSTSPAQPTLDT